LKVAVRAVYIQDRKLGLIKEQEVYKEESRSFTERRRGEGDL
jgi:hypothetical protein